MAARVAARARAAVPARPAHPDPASDGPAPAVRRGRPRPAVGPADPAGPAPRSGRDSCVPHRRSPPPALHCAGPWRCRPRPERSTARSRRHRTGPGPRSLRCREVGVDSGSVLYLLGAGGDFRQEARVGGAGDDAHRLQAQRGLLQIKVAGDGRSTRPSSAGSASTFHHCPASTATPWPCGTWVRCWVCDQAGPEPAPTCNLQAPAGQQRARAQHCLQGESAPGPGTATEVIRLTTSPPTCRRSMKATVRLWSEHGELVRKRSPQACGSGSAAPVFHCAFNAFPVQNTGCFSRRIAHCDVSPARRAARVNILAAGSQSLRSRRWLSVHRGRADRSTGLERLLATHGRIRPDNDKRPFRERSS